MSDLTPKPNLSPSVQTQGGIGSASVPAIEHGELHHDEHDHEHHDQHWLWKYVFSQDHKQIGSSF